ncbi:hypothetical protein [Leptospira yasudae]|uniref:hypothetical protein n=1 Tax=Leptospira yasudae TaxID=2202201 RepID=UPI0010911095|nr:hypothetical protein [Leptospira yasudae]TGM95976.1 hypothetical protein EHR10_18255 [Leptospira yasudae]
MDYLFLNILIILMVVGITRLIWLKFQLRKKLNFTIEFHNTFAKITKSKDEKEFNECFVFLSKRMSKLTSELGSKGFITYKPAFANYVHTNYQIVPNTLSMITSGRAEATDINFCSQLFLQHIGMLEEALEISTTKLFNPIQWIITGVNYFLALPLSLLSEFNLLSGRIYQAIINSLIFKVVSGLTGICALLSSIITIVIGWNEFQKLIQTFLNI